ncbi:MAG: peptide-methionine (S)-S-oxide reductase MsrA [Isosphaeraceae bacterium]|jgi:peptide-methionine (S)-S-oxide reductase
MIQRLLVVSLGIAVVLGLAGMVQTPKKAKQPSAPASKSDENAMAGPDQKNGSDTEKKAEKDQGKTKNTASATKEKKTEKATFGGGCFWCMEAVFERIPGVKSVVSGYAGGHVPNPTYEMVCTGLTGHAEVIQIEYDPAVVSYEKLLSIFWVAHDPTTLNRQEDDFGPNYRSIILYRNDEQKEAAEKSCKDLTRRRVFRSPIVTELVPLTEFYPAEAYHQGYYRNHRGSAYSDIHIVPKLRKLKQKLK